MTDSWVSEECCLLKANGSEAMIFCHTGRTWALGTSVFAKSCGSMTVVLLQVTRCLRCNWRSCYRSVDSPRQKRSKGRGTRAASNWRPETGPSLGGVTGARTGSGALPVVRVEKSSRHGQGPPMKTSLSGDTAGWEQTLGVTSGPVCIIATHPEVPQLSGGRCHDLP